jgi:hypothetical protein
MLHRLDRAPLAELGRDLEPIVAGVERVEAEAALGIGARLAH